MPVIKCESRAFPASGPVVNGCTQLDASWADILWAAMTVGRPSRNAVLQYGDASLYEAVFRLSLVRMAIEERPPNQHLWRTAAARTLDTTEKGAVSYFLGMLMCKLFADKLLNAPWMLHLDVFRPTLDVQLSGRSRPDLIGQRNSGEWIALESKGRVTPPEPDAKTKAKQQAQRCVSVTGSTVQFHIGAITFFADETLSFYWRDPEPSPEELMPIEIDVRPEIWRYHYECVLAYSGLDGRESLQAAGEPTGSQDLTVKLHPELKRLLIQQRWGEARSWCNDHREELLRGGFRSDGTMVVAGESWRSPFVDKMALDTEGGPN